MSQHRNNNPSDKGTKWKVTIAELERALMEEPLCVGQLTHMVISLQTHLQLHHSLYLSISAADNCKLDFTQSIP